MLMRQAYLCILEEPSGLAPSQARALFISKSSALQCMYSVLSVGVFLDELGMVEAVAVLVLLLQLLLPAACIDCHCCPALCIAGVSPVRCSGVVQCTACLLLCNCMESVCSPVRCSCGCVCLLQVPFG